VSAAKSSASVPGRTGKPNPVDVHVGRRVRLRRTLLGMSQGKLGTALGLTFQQIQKYERGTNRVGASRLFRLCQVLDVPVSYFFDEMPRETLSATAPLPGFAEGAPEAFEHEPDPMAKRETLALVRYYYRITDPKLRRRVFELTRSLAETGGADEETP
jgi:transcriptional regulator with XRE-family HTH domain